MASAARPRVRRAPTACPPSRRRRTALLADWHRRKTAIYKEMVPAGSSPPRPGIARIVDEALDAGWTLAVASTSAEASVRAVLEHAGRARQRAARFASCSPATCVPRKKPAPGIYKLALERLGVEPDDAIVIEDSRNGLLAAVGAGLRCVVTVSELHGRGGHRARPCSSSRPRRPGARPAEVLANRTRAHARRLRHAGRPGRPA